MKSLSIRKILTVGLSLLCLTYAAASSAAPPATAFPQIKITGLSKFKGQFIDLYYVAVRPADTIAVNLVRPVSVIENNIVFDASGANNVFNLMTLHASDPASEQITQDQLEIGKALIPQYGAFPSNAIKIVIHPSKDFQLVLSEMAGGIFRKVSNATAIYEIQLSKMGDPAVNVTEVQF